MTTIRNSNLPGGDALSMNSLNLDDVGGMEGLKEASLLLQDLVSFDGVGSPLASDTAGTGALSSPLAQPSFANLLTQLGIDANSPAVGTQLRQHNAANAAPHTISDYINATADQLDSDSVSQFQGNQQLQAFMDLEHRINLAFTMLSKLRKEADKTKGTISQNMK